MEYLKLVIESIITEEVNITKITDAIRKRKPVRMTYEADDEPKGQGERLIHPVAYGISRAGNMVLRAFQPYGDTKTKIPHWKLFRIDKIKNWNILWKRQSFDEPPGQYNSSGKYNPNGDNSMSQVYLSANFQNSRDFMSGVKGQGLMRYNKKREEEKLLSDPFYKLKKNLQNADTDKEVTKRVANSTSNAAKDYVNNDSYIDDLNRVNNIPNDIPQTSGPFKKGDGKKQTTTKAVKEPITPNNSPLLKNNEVENNTETENNLTDKDNKFYDRSTVNPNIE